jgi:hypothetical protein
MQKSNQATASIAIDSLAPFSRRFCAWQSPMNKLDCKLAYSYRLATERPMAHGAEHQLAGNVSLMANQC